MHWLDFGRQICVEESENEDDHEDMRTVIPSATRDQPGFAEGIDFPASLGNDERMFVYPKRYQVLVVGGGHAGIEAAMAAARLGCRTMMLTQNLDTIGQMSCNPAVGGLAKGHMVREIDALGGVMGLNTDATGIQFRTLNSNKGPSVRAPRAQCDKKAYQFRMKALIEAEPNLDLLQGNVLRIVAEGGVVQGIETTLGLQSRSRSGDHHDRNLYAWAVACRAARTRPGAGWGMGFRP